MKCSLATARGCEHRYGPLAETARTSNKGIVSMSSEHSNFVQKFAAAFAQLHRVRNETTENDTDRLIALIDAATAAFDVNDPAAVESLFALGGAEWWRAVRRFRSSIVSIALRAASGS